MKMSDDQKKLAEDNIKLVYYYLYNNNLSMDEISLFANEDVIHTEMAEIRKGLENGLSIEQVSIYVDDSFDAPQMRQIRLGLENGLSDEQVSSYAYEDFSWEYMKKAREEMENNLSSETQDNLDSYDEPDDDYEL